VRFSKEAGILSGAMATGVTVLALYDRISLYHTLAPWITGMHRRGWDAGRADRAAGVAGAAGPAAPDPAARGGAAPATGTPPRITWTDNPEWCLTRDTNEHLIIVRRFLKPPVVDLALMERLRRRYRRIFFLNGNAGGGLHRPEVLPYVDRFYNKALFVDRSLYTRELYGGELFTDVAHRTLGVVDPEPVVPPPVPEVELPKLHRHWNIGVGDFPRRKLVQRVGVALARVGNGGGRGGATGRLWTVAGTINRREMISPAPLVTPVREAYRYDVNARLGRPGYPTIAHHRSHLGAVLEEAARRRDWRVARDRVPGRQYFTDMQHSLVTFSPFGWGELCFRDFEAVRAGSLLIKPDMSHLTTWPDIFRPGETYIPVRWDGTDLEETIAYWTSRDHDEERRSIIAAAHARFRSELEELPSRSAAVLRELTSPGDLTTPGEPSEGQP
jgi:hypothetical protein